MKGVTKEYFLDRQEEAKAVCRKARDEIEQIVLHIFEFGDKNMANRLEKAVMQLQNAEFEWGNHAAALSIMRANRWETIHDGAGIKKKV